MHWRSEQAGFLERLSPGGCSSAPGALVPSAPVTQHHCVVLQYHHLRDSPLPLSCAVSQAFSVCLLPLFDGIQPPTDTWNSTREVQLFGRDIACIYGSWVWNFILFLTPFIFHLFLLLKIITDLQYCVSVWCTTQWFSYACIYIYIYVYIHFQILFPYTLL